MTDNYLQKDIFCTYGSLKVSLSEVIDVFPVPKTKPRKNDAKKQKFVVSVSISDSNGKDIVCYNTCPHFFYPNETTIVGEEFLFDGVSSSNCLIVTFYAIVAGQEYSNNKMDGSTSSRLLSSMKCLGLTSIPISRLEENNQSAQWYQMFSDVAPNEGLRCSAKIECIFVNEGPPPSSSVPPRRQSISVSQALNNITPRRATIKEDQSSVSTNTHYAGSVMLHSQHNLMELNEAISTAAALDAIEHGGGGSADESNSPRRHSVVTANGTTFGAGADELTQMDLAKNNLFHRRWFNRLLRFAPEAQYQYQQSEFELREHERLQAIDDRRNYRLETGIIDYCLVLGPESPYSLYPTHYISKSGQLVHIIYPATPSEAGGGSSNSSASPGGLGMNSPLGTGLFSGSSSQIRNEEQDVVMYDRLPRQDLLNIEIPSKIEWFACPEGSKTVMHDTRPEPYFTSFVLSAGGETDEQYGLTLNFFVNVSVVDDFNSIASPKNQQTNTATAPVTAEMKQDRLAAELLAAEDLKNLLWWHPHFTAVKAADGSSQDTPRTKGMSSLIKPERLVKKWTTVSMCVLFHKPFIQQLTHCLTCAYRESILPKLAQWEDLRDEAITQQLQSICSEQNNPQFFRTVNFENYKCSIKPFPVFAEKLLAILCLECPLPLPGLLSINLQLPRESPGDCSLCKQHESHKSKEGRWLSDESLLTDAGSAVDAEGTPNLHSIHFSLNKLESLPQCCYPIELLLKFFGPRVLIDVVCCILSECRMLFHSNDISKLPIICEALRVIIYPLKWTHVYLPVVPSHLLNLVEAPVPFMLGTHTKWLNHVHLDYLVDIVLVDCESGAIDMGSAQTMRFPDLEDRWLLQSLNAIATPQFLSEDPTEYFAANLDEMKSRQASECVWKGAQSCPSSLNAVCNVGLQIQLLFFDVLFQLLRYVPDCLFYLNPSCPVFNRPLFINDYTTDECRPCMEFITVTNSFHELTETIHSPSLSFFYDCIHRQIASERKELQASLENNSSKTDVLTSSGSSGVLSASTPGGRGITRGFSISSGGIRTPGPKLKSPAHRGLLRSRSGASAVSGTDFGPSPAATATPSPIPSLMNPRELLLKKGYSTTSVDDLTLDITPSPGGEGGVNNPDYLSPPDSLSSASAATPLPGDSPAVRFANSSSSNPMGSPVVTSHKSPPPPRGIIPQKSLTGRGLMRNVSVMGMGAGGSLLESNSTTPLGSVAPASAAAAAAAAAAAMVELDAHNTDSANEVVYRGLLPEWLLRPVKSGQSSTGDDVRQSNKVDSIRSLLIRRLKQYLPHLDPALHFLGRKPSPKNMDVYKEHTLTLDTNYTEIADTYSFTSPLTRTPHSTHTTGTRHRIVTRKPTFVNEVAANLDTSRSDASDDTQDTEEIRPINIRTNSGMSSLFPDVQEDETEDSEDEENAADKEARPYLNSESLDLSANSDTNAAAAPVLKTRSTSVESMLPALQLAAAGISMNDFSDDEGGTESVEIPSSSLLVRFDDPSIIHIQRQIFTWTVYDIADQLNLPRDNLWRWFQQSGTLEAKKGILGGAAPKMNQRNIISQASSKKLNIDSSGDSAATCDDRVLQFIQKIVTQCDGNDSWFESSIDECLDALNEGSNRLGLISVLRHAKKSEDHHPDANSNVIPLNNHAFKGFSKLFNGLLGICTSVQDYLCAYNLLEVGGLYFHIIDEGDGYRNTNNSSMDTLYDPDEEDIIEFLSERISSHPIYQSTNLWRAILLSRLPAVVPSSTPDKIKQQQQQHQPRTRRESVGSTFGTSISLTFGDDDKKGVKGSQQNINTVISEVHSLLYIMLGMGVNSSRAVHFIQAIAADYNLGINEYYKLQRFTTRMWSASGNDDADDLNESVHGDSGQNDGAVTEAANGGAPSLNKKKSKDVTRDRRASVSINDMLSKQGHGNKLLEPHSSRDLNNAEHQGSNYHLHRASSTDTIGGGYDIRTMSMDDVIGNSAKFTAAGGDKSDLGRSYHRKRKPTIAMTKNTSHDDLELAQNTARNTTLATFSIDDGSKSNNTSGTGLNVFVDSTYGIEVPVMDSPSMKGTGVAAAFSYTPKPTTAKANGNRNVITSASKYNNSGDVGNKYEPFNIKTIEDGHATLLTCIDHYLAAGSDDGNLCISDLSDGSEVLRMKHSSASGGKYTGITGLASLSSGVDNGYLFFSACSQGIVKAWTLPTKTIEHHQQQQQLNKASNSTSSSYWGGGVAALNLRLKQSLSTIKSHSHPINCLIASRHETHGWLLASGDTDGEITLSRGTEGSSTTVSVGSNLGLAGSFCSCENNGKAGGRTSITSMSFMNKTLGGGSDAASKTLSVDPLDVQNKKKSKSSAKNGSGANSSNNPGSGGGNEDYLAVGTSTGVVVVLDMRTGMPSYFSEDHKGAVTQVLGLRASSFISAGVDRCIKLWDIRIKSRVQSFGGGDQKTLEMRSLGGVNDNYYRCAASPITALAVGGWDNTLVVSASADGTVRLWDLRHDVSVPCNILKGHCNRVTSVHWNGKDDVHTASHDGTVRSWDSINGRNINVLRVFDTDEGISSLDVASFTRHNPKASSEAVEDISDVHVVHRSCLITGSWNGAVRGFYCDSSL